MFEKLFMMPKLAKYAAGSKKWMDLFGFVVRDINVSEDSVSCTITFPEKLTGNNGVIHGGIICFVMDSLAGVFASVSSDSSKTILTKDLSVSFIKPVAPNIPYTVIVTRVFATEVLVKLLDSDEQEMAIGRLEMAEK